MAQPKTGRPRGNPAKPVEQKRLLGNPGKRPMPPQLSVMFGSSEPPDPPRPLGQAGTELWNRAWKAGRQWVDPGADLEVMLLLCEQTDERSQLRVKVIRDGERFERGALRALDAQIMAGLSALGFTPVDRARMGVGVDRELSALDDLRRRSAR